MSADRRPLSEREKEILRFLLAVEVPPERVEAFEALRAEVATATVTERWDCCPSVEMMPAPDAPEPQPEHRPIVEASHRSLQGSEPFQLLLFVTADGHLRTLELVHYDPDRAPLDEIPPPADFQPPRLMDDPPPDDASVMFVDR